MAEQVEGGASRIEQRQVELILDSFPEAAPFPPNWRTAVGGCEYLYRRSKIIVRDSNLDSIVRGLEERQVRFTIDREFALAGATRLTLPDTNEDDADRSIRTELAQIWALEGQGAAGLDHLYYVCVHACAAIEPEEVAADATPVPEPEVGQDAANPQSRQGTGVDVLVLDTGLVPDAAADHPWLQGVTGDEDNPLGPDGQIRQDGGHGTFTAGCVRVTAPEAGVRVVNAASLIPVRESADEIGAVFESELANLLRSHLVAAEGEPPVRVPDIVVLNFAGTTEDGRPPVALAALYDSVIQHLKEVLVLSPAGNEPDDRKNWPASFSWVVSVGGLAENRSERASWSNFARTVDVYAPGDRLVNAFAKGDYVCKWDEEPHDERRFYGMALWSGTSFSTPLVAGLVASRMSTTGQSSRRAWESLLDVAEQQAIPGVGPVLYPGQELA
jgi:hypothetical protein